MSSDEETKRAGQGPLAGRVSDLLWGPVFARGFDRFNKGAEDAGAGWSSAPAPGSISASALTR
jgi:hypothetical protein